MARRGAEEGVGDATRARIELSRSYLEPACGLLLIRRTDNENWAMPGGAMDIGETIADAAVRETRKETGIELRDRAPRRRVTNTRHVMLYMSNNEVRQECSLVFAA